MIVACCNYLGSSAVDYRTVLVLKSLVNIVSGNSLCPGDHIPWRRSLDGSDSRIQHMLMANDAQLEPITTPLGTVNFVQV